MVQLSDSGIFLEKQKKGERGRDRRHTRTNLMMLLLVQVCGRRDKGRQRGVRMTKEAQL